MSNFLHASVCVWVSTKNRGKGVEERESAPKSVGGTQKRWGKLLLDAHFIWGPWMGPCPSPLDPSP